jgi:hypothetical protein
MSLEIRPLPRLVLRSCAIERDGLTLRRRPPARN